MAAKVPDHRRHRRRPARQPRGRRQGRPQGGRPRRAGRDRARRPTSARHPAVDAGQRLDSPWVLDDLTTLVTEIGDKLDVDHGAEGRGRRGHPLRRPPARPARGQGRARPGRSSSTPSSRPPAAWPTSRRSAAPRPRMQGLSLGPADLAANRRMKTTRVGGGHPGYLVRDRPGRRRHRRCAARRPTSRTCGTTRSPAWSTPARCTGSSRTTARSATSRTSSPARTSSATPTCSAASARGGCTRCRSRSPSASSARPPSDVAHARRVIEAMGDGTGAVMLDGKMEDDASLKQCQVIVELAEQLSADRPRARRAVCRARAATPTRTGEPSAR